MFFNLPLLNQNKQRGRQENGRIGSKEHSGGEHQSEVFSGSRTEEKERQQNQNDGKRSTNGPHIGLFQTPANRFAERWVKFVF